MFVGDRHASPTSHGMGDGMILKRECGCEPQLGRLSAPNAWSGASTCEKPGSQLPLLTVVTGANSRQHVT
jgi:hypothetical protein